MSRAVSTNVGYVLTLAVSSLVITGLLVGAGGFIDNQRQQTVRGELETVGQQLATDMGTAGELARTDGSVTTIELRRTLPSRITGLQYAIAIDDDAIELSTTDPDVTVRVPLSLSVDVAASTVDGGDLRIVYEDADGDSNKEVVVRGDE